MAQNNIVSIVLSDAEKAVVNRVATRANRSRSYVVRRMIQLATKQMEVEAEADRNLQAPLTGVA